MSTDDKLPFPDHVAMAVLHRHMHWYLFDREGKPWVIKRYYTRKRKGPQEWVEEGGGLDSRHLTDDARKVMTKAWEEHAAFKELHAPPPPPVPLKTERQGILADALRAEQYVITEKTIAEWEKICRRAGIRDYDEAAAFVHWVSAEVRRVKPNGLSELAELVELYAPQWIHHKPRHFRAGA